MTLPSKLIVIGLDGATWSLIDPLIEAGRLPNLARLKEEGASGPLTSCILPWTFPAWRVYSSGRNPGKLGVYWFSRLDWSKKQFALNDATAYQGPDLWDYLNAEGLRTGVIDMPATFPPRPLDGFMIAGYPAEDRFAFTHPLELKTKLVEQFGYQTYTKTTSADKEAYLAEQQAIIRSRFAVAKSLLHQVDFLHLTIFCIDQIQHVYWQDEGLYQTWEVLDEEIGRFVTDPDTTYLFMSDHGFGPGQIEELFQLNAWLVEQGHLQLKASAASLFQKLGLSRRGLVAALRKVGLYNLLRRWVPANVKRAIPIPQEATGEAMMFGREPLIDWDESQAIADGHGLIYLNPSLSDAHRETLATDLKRHLAIVVSPATGKTVAQKVFLRDELYRGPDLSGAPDLVMLGRDGCLIKDGVGGQDVFQSATNERWNAKHALQGIFMAWGRDIAAGQQVTDANLIDLAPTVLHALGHGVPNDMDGTPLLKIFTRESAPANAAVRVIDPLADQPVASEAGEARDRDMEERLRDLGYL